MSDPHKSDPQKQISPERKAMYYGGMAASGVGFLMFISTFFLFAANFGKPMDSGSSIDAVESATQS